MEQEVDICYMCMQHKGQLDEEFVESPCDCKGSQKIHFYCLAQMIANGFQSCGACKKDFIIKRNQKSVYIWSIDKNMIKIAEMDNTHVCPCGTCPLSMRYTHLHGIVEYRMKDTMQLNRKTTYANNKRHGLEEIWATTKKGKYYLSSQINYKNNKLDGTYKKYYPNGVIETDATYLNNQKHGPFVRKYEHGKIMQSTTYVNGQIDGTFKSFYPSGITDTECTYVMGKIHGPYKKFRVDGSTHTIATYDNGKVIAEGVLHPVLQEFNQPY